MKVEFEKNTLLPLLSKFAQAMTNTPIKNAKYVGGGGFGAVYEIIFANGKVQILKVYKVTESMQVEVQALQELKQASPIKIPKIYYTHSSDEKFPFDIVAMEKIEGKNAARTLLPISYKKCKNFRDKLINSLGKMHEFDCGQKYGLIGSDETFDSWQAFYIDFFSKVFVKAKDFCADNTGQSKKLYNLLERGMNKIDYILSEPIHKPSLVHGDIWLPNVMVNPSTFEPTGILDPLNAMRGDKEYDLFPLDAPIKKRLELYQAYKNKFETTEKVDLKIALYALVSEVSCNIKSQHRTGSNFYNFLIKRLSRQYKIHGI